MTVFADLGRDDEWPGTAELAAEHAAFYGLRHEVVFREVTAPDGRRVPQSLTEHIAERGEWPEAARLYCNSDMKRTPVHQLFARIAEHRAARPGRKVRILSVLGMRAQESRARALLLPFDHDARASNRTLRHVDRWLPVHELTTGEIWEVIAQAGTRPHWVYAHLPRLSCRFCVLVSKSALVRAARLDPSGPLPGLTWKSAWVTGSARTFPWPTSSPLPAASLSTLRRPPPPGPLSPAAGLAAGTCHSHPGKGQIIDVHPERRGHRPRCRRRTADDR
jgi:3'-phosphoadenosine 5'-phosphosulfate sulfotransferase (PAPS reductase)/FAD synthetase